MSAPQVVDAAPYDLAPRGEPTGAAVLCVHGLTGTPYEVRPIAEVLADRGFRARGPLLPGHGGRPEVLARVSHVEWTRFVRQEYLDLRREHDRVFVCGMSLGGLLTLWLAAHEQVDAIAVVGTPLRFRAFLPLLIAAARFVRPMLSKEGGSDIADPVARGRHPSMSHMPTASVHELIGLQRVVRRVLGQVRAPVLAAHGALDRTAPPENLAASERGVGSARVERLLLERSGHVVPVDYDGPRVAQAVADFFVSVARDAGQEA